MHRVDGDHAALSGARLATSSALKLGRGTYERFLNRDSLVINSRGNNPRFNQVVNVGHRPDVTVEAGPHPDRRSLSKRPHEQGAREAIWRSRNLLEEKAREAERLAGVCIGEQ